MTRAVLLLTALLVLPGIVHAENMDTPEAILLDQDRINNEQAQREIDALQRQLDEMFQSDQNIEPDRYEAEDLDHAHELWDAQSAR